MNIDDTTVEMETLSDIHNTTDVVKPETKLHHSSTPDVSIEPKNNPKSKFEENKDDNEPLFVIDTTKDFQLNYPIKYESYNGKANSSRSNARFRSQNACWNCGSTDHALNNCPKARNHRKISKNRQIFLKQKQQQQPPSRYRVNSRKNERYFGKDQSQSFIRFTPGKLSEDLLQALDVPSNRLPLHVYQMRKWGYPNGWLEEAKEKYSGITIFTAPNECVPLPGSENESDGSYCKINKNKLYKYPGFNVPCLPSTVDECKFYGCPEFNPEQSLDYMYESLISNTFNKNNDDIGVRSKTTETLTGEKSLKSKIAEENSNSTPPSPPEDGEITDEDICLDANSEECTLNKSNETVPEKEINDKSHTDLFESCVEQIDQSANGTKSSLSNSLYADCGSVLSTSSSSTLKFGDVKSKVLGTPILQRFSNYENRPTHANFAKGMVDMIDHENLPNSVGTFKKIKEILNDVRKTLNNLL